MTTPRSLCDGCKYYDIAIEFRGGAQTQYPSCMFFHQWFKRVTEPKQCRDYESAASVED